MPQARILNAKDPGLRHLKHFPKGHLALVAGVSAALFVALTLAPADNASAYRSDSLSLPAAAPSRVNSAERIELTLELPDTDPSKLFEEDDPNSFVPEADWHTEKVRRGDSLARIFGRLRLSSVELDTVMKLGTDTSVLKSLRPGDVVEVSRDEEGRLEALRYALSSSDTLIISREGEEFVAEKESKPVESRLGFGCGTIESSLFGAGQKAGLSDSQIMQMANIFEYDIDFHQELHKGDNFCVVYEERYIDGVKVENGPITAAEFYSGGQRYSAVRYTDRAGETSYYADTGLALKKAFLRAPLKFNRISSDFNPNRRHPVLNKIRAHKGTDYAAPTGTPVFAPSNGVVQFVGKQNGYGNVIVLSHAQNYSTKYAHLSRFSKGLRKGQKVKQGDVIGAVGQTGLASGPHLHYEFLVGGVHKNPRTIALPKADPVPASERSRFFAAIEPLKAQLALRRQFILAQNDKASGAVATHNE